MVGCLLSDTGWLQVVNSFSFQLDAKAYRLLIERAGQAKPNIPADDALHHLIENLLFSTFVDFQPLGVVFNSIYGGTAESTSIKLHLSKSKADSLITKLYQNIPFDLIYEFKKRLFQIYQTETQRQFDLADVDNQSETIWYSSVTIHTVSIQIPVRILSPPSPIPCTLYPLKFM